VSELVDQRSSGPRCSSAGRSISSTATSRTVTRRRGTVSSPRAWALVSLAPVRLQVADHHIAAAIGLGLTLLEHPVGLADAGGHAEEDLVVAAFHPRPSGSGSQQVVDDQVDQLDADEGDDQAPRP